MKIHGLQKCSLLDFPGHTAATVFLGGCDMRCPYCHNAEIWDASLPALLEEEELYQFLEERRGFLEGVCFTGGEPLLRRDLPDVIRRVRSMGYLIKVDTNGLHPDILQQFLDEHLVDRIAMDIKNEPDRYAETVGISVDLSRIRRSVSLLLANPSLAEFRTTVTNAFHDCHSFMVIADWLAGAPFFALQPFRVTEFVPDQTLGTPTKEALEAYAAILRQTITHVEIRG